jgi:alpha-maltose-1-phosphate synthase
LDAWSKAGARHGKLTLIGPVSANMEKYIRTRFPEIEVKGKLSFEEVKRCLPDYDVMVFPSFFEGFGLVIPEAMASGLPVITTTATCGPDVIVNGQEGYVIEPGDEDQLKEAIKFFIAEPSKARVMGKLARKKAEQLTWNAHGEKWVQTLILHTNKKYPDIAGKEQAEKKPFS